MLQLSNTRLATGATNENSSNVQNTYSSSEEDKELLPSEKSLLQKIVRTGLITSKHDIEVQRRDPKSPLFSIKSFEELKL